MFYFPANTFQESLLAVYLMILIQLGIYSFFIGTPCLINSFTVSFWDLSHKLNGLSYIYEYNVILHFFPELKDAVFSFEHSDLLESCNKS